MLYRLFAKHCGGPDIEKISPTILDFLTYLTIYYKKRIMECKKRVFRELSDETKTKISSSSKGKPKSALHKIHISQSMKRYWQTIPHKSETKQMMDDLLRTESDD